MLRRSDFDARVPFTLAEAVGAGLDPSELRSRRRYRRLHRGVYVARPVRVTVWVRARAALKLHPADAFASHHTAACRMGLPVPACDRAHVTVAQQEQRVQRYGIACHVACVETTVATWQGIRISSPPDLFIELAGVLRLVDLVIVGDAMVAAGHVGAEELRDFCASTSRRHSRRARRGASYVRAGVDSPMETRLRMLLVLAGLPEPTVNHVIRDAQGRVVRRLDLSYPGAKVIVEYDGRQHALDATRWATDIDRREQLDEQEWRMVVVLSSGVFLQPERTIARVERVLRQRGVRVGPLSDEWRAHFPAG